VIGEVYGRSSSPSLLCSPRSRWSGRPSSTTCSNSAWAI